MDEKLSPSYFTANYKGLTGDKRLDKRAQTLSKILSQNPCSTISKLSSSRAEQIGYYRLLENEKLTEEGLIKELTSRVSCLVAGRDVLCVQDTSEINVSGNKNRLQPDSGLGKSDNADNATCFKIHPGLVLDPDEPRVHLANNVGIIVRSSLRPGLPVIPAPGLRRPFFYQEILFFVGLH